MSTVETLDRSASARVMVLGALDRIACASHLNATTAVYAERALARADVLDAARAKGQPSGALAGIPFAAKDLFDVAGRVTRAGSRIATGAAAARDAAAIRRLEAAGAILVASAQMDELAYGFSGENHHDGDCRNPHDPARSAGGSSSGSAVLVAGGCVPLTLGTDTNGSIRVPAALSGVYGLKPTYGAVSRQGVIPFVQSLDHVGVLAEDPGLLALAMEALTGLDGDDPVSANGIATGINGAPARLGGWFSAPLHPDVRAAVESACAALGAATTVTLPLAEEARAAAFILTTAEGGQAHFRALVDRPEGFGPLVRDRLRAGAMVPAVWTARAQKLRRLVTRELVALLAKHPILIAPATPCPAFPLGEEMHIVEGVELPIRLGIGTFTQPLTLTGVPIVTVPRKGAGGLPVGVQLIGRAHDEGRLIAAAHILARSGFGLTEASDD